MLYLLTRSYEIFDICVTFNKLQTCSLGEMVYLDVNQQNSTCILVTWRKFVRKEYIDQIR